MIKWLTLSYQVSSPIDGLPCLNRSRRASSTRFHADSREFWWSRQLSCLSRTRFAFFLVIDCFWKSPRCGQKAQRTTKHQTIVFDVRSWMCETIERPNIFMPNLCDMGKSHLCTNVFRGPAEFFLHLEFVNTITFLTRKRLKKTNFKNIRKAILIIAYISDSDLRKNRAGALRSVHHSHSKFHRLQLCRIQQSSDDRDQVSDIRDRVGWELYENILSGILLHLTPKISHSNHFNYDRNCLNNLENRTSSVTVYRTNRVRTHLWKGIRINTSIIHFSDTVQWKCGPFQPIHHHYFDPPLVSPVAGFLSPSHWIRNVNA